MRRLARCVAALAFAALAPGRAATQKPPSVRWVKGEFLEYTVKFGPIPAGSARLEVLGTDTIRGRTAWRMRLNVTGGVWPCRVNDYYDSWLDSVTLNSLRYEQNIAECSYRKKRVYEIFPERSRFVELGKEEQPSVESPLDDASFFYFLRSIPLAVGKEYSFNRHFDPKNNPVAIAVERTEALEVPAGKFDAIVLQPTVGGLLSKDAHAEIWLSNDDRRILLQMKTRLSFGSISLYLRKIVIPKDSAARSGAPR